MEYIRLKNSLGYESLTPRPNYQEIFKRRNLDVKKDGLGIKIMSGKINSAQVTEELINRIKLMESERALMGVGSRNKPLELLKIRKSARRSNRSSRRNSVQR